MRRLSRAQPGMRWPQPIRRAAVLIAACVVAAGLPIAHVRAQASREYAIKAECLARFPQFVDWPSQALAENSPTIVVGVVGSGPAAAALDAINGRSVAGKRLVVRSASSAPEMRNSHILFVTASARDRVSQILNAVGGTPVLTVGEPRGFARSGGIVSFNVRGNSLDLEINLAAAERAGLRISSRLLRLAKNVIRS